MNEFTDGRYHTDEERGETYLPESEQLALDEKEYFKYLSTEREGILEMVKDELIVDESWLMACLFHSIVHKENPTSLEQAIIELINTKAKAVTSYKYD